MALDPRPRRAARRAAALMLDGLASCRRRRRLVLALPEPDAPRFAIRWNPDLLERAGIAALVGAEAVRRQGFAAPPCSLHRHVAEEDSS